MSDLSLLNIVFLINLIFDRVVMLDRGDRVGYILVEYCISNTFDI